MFKRMMLLAVLLGVVTPFIMAGCGKKNETSPAGPTTEEEQANKWKQQEILGTYDPENPE